MVFVSTVSWSVQMTRAVASIGRAVREMPVPRLRSGGGKAVPRGMRTLRDSKNRFILKLPREWRLTTKGAVVGVSPRVGSMVRVDVFEKESALWERLIGSLRHRGAKVELRSDAGPRMLRIRCEVGIDGTRFDWRARRYSVDGEDIVLSLGNVLAPTRSRTLERYEDRILDAIRRSFMAPAPGGSRKP